MGEGRDGVTAHNDVNLIDSYSLPPSNSYPNITTTIDGDFHIRNHQHPRHGLTHTENINNNNNNNNYYPEYEPFKAEDSEQITISTIDKTEEIQKIINTKNKRLALDYKQDIAHKRREMIKNNRMKEKLVTSQKRELTTREMQHKRWLDDFIREQNSSRIRSKSDDHLLLRKVRYTYYVSAYILVLLIKFN